MAGLLSPFHDGVWRGTIALRYPDNRRATFPAGVSADANPDFAGLPSRLSRDGYWFSDHRCRRGDAADYVCAGKPLLQEAGVENRDQSAGNRLPRLTGPTRLTGQTWQT